MRLQRTPALAFGTVPQVNLLPPAERSRREHALLVGVPEAGRAAQHRVLLLRGSLDPAEARVERSQEGELAARCGAEVARARHDAPVLGEEHAHLPLAAALVPRTLAPATPTRSGIAAGPSASRPRVT